MQRYYCDQCARYFESDNCPTHGSERIVYLDSDPFANANIQGVRTPDATPSGVSVSAAGKLQSDEPSGNELPKKISENPLQDQHAPKQPGSGQPQKVESREILRFLKSERRLHWSIAFPFIICWTTALVLVFFYNPNPLRPYRDLVSWIHRISGVCLIILPPLAVLTGWKEYRVHLKNIKIAWFWSFRDLKWLFLMGLAAVSKKIVLPDQDKFNAAEKVNFISVMLACPLFIVTGLMIWLQSWGWAAWLVHASLAVLVSPTMLGHIYMATINPGTRVGIKGMITGYVDRHWAKHHYALWYRDNFETDRHKRDTDQTHVLPPDRHVYMKCPGCTEKVSVNWSWLLPRLISGAALICPSCGESFDALDSISDPQQMQWIKDQFQPGQTGTV